MAEKLHFYPILRLRLKAMMLDSFIVGVIFLVLILLAVKIDFSNTLLTTSFIMIPVILFEPMMIWKTGGSVGHHYAGIRIVCKDTGDNLFLINGIIRFIAKNLLGVFSLFSMVVTRRRQSIHDYPSNSGVVFSNEELVSPTHKLKENG